MNVRYSVYEAKAKLSALLRQVKARHEVVITEHGRPIARVVPFDNGKTESLDERIDRLQAEGVIRRGHSTFGEALDKVETQHKPGALGRFLAERKRD